MQAALKTCLRVKVCLSCDFRFDSTDWQCPSCGWRPVNNRFVLFAPELAETDEGFPLESFEQLAKVEPTSFWFRARNRLVVQLVAENFPKAESLLELGCGTGFVLSGLRRSLPALELAGSELHVGGLAFAGERLPGVALYQMDCRHIPFEAEFDVVCALDVLEHVGEDDIALSEMFKAVKPGGGVLVSVPQHPWLWSAGDSYAHHERRYRRRDLEAKLRSAGFDVIRVTSFVFLLLPLMMVARAFQRDQGTYDPSAEYRSPRLVDRTLEAACEVDRWLIARGLSLPAGGSLFAVAQKPA